MNEHHEVEDLFIDKYADCFDLLLVTATETEKKELHKHLKPLPGQTKVIKVYKGKYTYYVGVFGRYYAVHVACNDMGSSQRNASLVTTVDAANTWSPKVALMVGIAFGADKKKQKIGDVLVSERIINYEPQRKGKETTLMRGKEGPASSILIDRFKSVNDWSFVQNDRTPAIIVGTMLSGEKLIDDPDYKEELMKAYPEAIGGEMEGAGIYSACDTRVEHWILVKGICDYADGKKRRNKKANQKLAIESAVSLCLHVFSSSNALKAASLKEQDEVLNTDFSEDKGAIPAWMDLHAVQVVNKHQS